MKLTSWRMFFLATAIIFALPLTILLLYSHSITGEYLPVIDRGMSSLSKESDRWADFGSLLSGLFGLSSALATMLTLGFVIHQSEKSLKRSERDAEELNASQRKQNEKIDEYNSEKKEFYNKVVAFNHDVSDFQEKVNYFNEAQEKRNTFEKYKLHKEAFNDLLDDLIIDLQVYYKDKEVVLLQKTALYNSIFPANNFDFFDTRSSQNMSDLNAKFPSIFSSLRDIDSWLNADWGRDNYLNLLLPYEGILRQLNLNISHSGTVNGSVISRRLNSYLFNLTNFQNELNLITEFCNRIFLFSGVEPFSQPPQTPDFLITDSRLVKMREDIMYNNRNLKEMYTVEGSGLTTPQSTLLKTYNLIRLIEKEIVCDFGFDKANLRIMLVSYREGKSPPSREQVVDFYKTFREKINKISIDFQESITQSPRANEFVGQLTNQANIY